MAEFIAIVLLVWFIRSELKKWREAKYDGQPGFATPPDLRRRQEALRRRVAERVDAMLKEKGRRLQPQPEPRLTALEGGKK